MFSPKSMSNLGRFAVCIVFTFTKKFIYFSNIREAIIPRLLILSQMQEIFLDGFRL